MEILKYDQLAPEQKTLFQDILLSSFYGEYDTQKIERFGKNVAGKNFQMISREGIEGPVNYQGEICALLRLTQMPIQVINRLIVSDFLEYPQGTVEFKVSSELAKVAARNTKNLYHNVRHTCNFVAYAALSFKEGLSKRARYNLHNCGLIHDEKHPMIFGPFDELLKGCEPERVERRSLRMVGLQEKDGEVIVARNSPFLKLTKEDAYFTTQCVLATYLKFLPKIQKEYFDAYEKMKHGSKIPELIAARYMATRMDLGETMSLAGNSITTEKVMAEELYGLECCFAAGKLNKDQYEQFRAKIEREGTLEEMIKFQKFINPLNGCHSIGETALGIPEEVKKMIADAEKGIRHSVFIDSHGHPQYTSIISLPQNIHAPRRRNGRCR
ncbi:MAG: hypothetical protein ACOY3I_01835 [Verrucomicrobiota bacterium]